MVRSRQCALNVSNCQCWQIADHGWRVIESDDQATVLHADRDRPIPGVVVNTGIFLERQGRFGVGGAGCFRALHGLSRFLYLPIFDGF